MWITKPSDLYCNDPDTKLKNHCFVPSWMHHLIDCLLDSPKHEVAVATIGGAEMVAGVVDGAVAEQGNPWCWVRVEKDEPKVRTISEAEGHHLPIGGMEYKLDDGLTPFDPKARISEMDRGRVPGTLRRLSPLQPGRSRRILNPHFINPIKLDLEGVDCFDVSEIEGHHLPIGGMEYKINTTPARSKAWRRTMMADIKMPGQAFLKDLAEYSQEGPREADDLVDALSYAFKALKPLPRTQWDRVKLWLVLRLRAAADRISVRYGAK